MLGKLNALIDVFFVLDPLSVKFSFPGWKRHCLLDSRLILERRHSSRCLFITKLLFMFGVGTHFMWWLLVRIIVHWQYILVISNQWKTSMTSCNAFKLAMQVLGILVSAKRNYVVNFSWSFIGPLIFCNFCRIKHFPIMYKMT